MSKLPSYEELINVVNQLQQRVSELEGLPTAFEHLQKRNALLEENKVLIEQHKALLEKSNKQLRRKVELFEKKAAQLERKAEMFEERTKLLQRDNAILKEKLAKYENPKNSNNSSIPPSKDENRPFKSKSLRKKTGRKPGGQKGHKGTTLELTSNPDVTIDHAPEYCEC